MAASLRRVVVTGCGGRVGGAIAKRLKAEGRLLAGVDAKPGELVTSVLDLSGQEARAGLLEVLAEADGVVHAAALPGPSVEAPPRSANPEIGRELMRAGIIGLEDESPGDVLAKNTASAHAVFEAACASAGVRRVVFSSSAFAMGWSHEARAFAPERLPLTEGDEPTPFETYGLSKAVGEATAAMYARATGVEFVALRFTNIVKRELYPQTLPWRDAGLVPLVMGAWCHEDDVVDAHVRALECRLDESFEAFLIAAPSSRFEDASPIFDCSKAERALGWRPRCWTRGSEAARAALRDPELRVCDIGGFRLESGEVLPTGASLAYKVYASDRRDAPVVVHPTSFGATHLDLEYRIGPGKTLDTTRYTVVVPNMLGNGVSFSPSNAGSAGYPDLVSVADNVGLQRLALGPLLSRPTLLFGYSMGAMQAWEWARSAPDAVDALVAVCGSTGCTDYNELFLHTLLEVLNLDIPKPDKLRLFATVYAGWGVGYPLYRDRVHGRDSVRDFVDLDYVPGFANDDPDDLRAMLATWRAAAPFSRDDLAAITTPCLLMPCDTDTYFRLDQIAADEAAAVPDATLAPILSPYGHRAGDPSRPALHLEADHIRTHLSDFLDHRLPSS